jgi:hypothetical protein
MFSQYVYEQTYASNATHVLLIDEDGLEQKTNYLKEFENHGFQVILYEDDLSFRIEWEERFKYGQGKYLILAKLGAYIPYDIRKLCGQYQFRVSLTYLFPKLNAECIQQRENLNFDLLCMAYKKLYADNSSYQKTSDFINRVVYGPDNITEYVHGLQKNIEFMTSVAANYRDWIHIAEKKAELDVYCAEYGIDASAEFAHVPFLQFILNEFGKMSGKIASDTPVLVKSAMEYMQSYSEKFVIIVMDGMSEFDWTILSRYFTGIQYERSAAYAMIPTITSLSRQSLVSGKFPRQLLNPWSTSKEEKEFTDCAIRLGFRKEQIKYHRGYDADFGALIRCGCIIINDIDDLVHGQRQGRQGMYRDIEYLAKTGKLTALVQNLISKGFDVYISADHGNTPCTGQGKLMRLGVETETKSRRMVVLEKFADKEKMIAQYDLIEYPKYFLNKQYDYLICNIGKSFDAKGTEIMTHGGITLDEVIVPFIRIKAVDNNE